MRKIGISLIVLTITLIVMSVLAYTIVLSLNNSTDSAKEVGFATELKEILEASQAYYLQHGELPVASDVSYTKTNLLGITADSQELQNEFDINKDTNENYYKIDLNKIAKTSGLYGNNTKTNDFYVISEDCNFVYYPLGVKIGDDKYYSFTNKLAQITDLEIANGATGDVTAVTSADKIVVSKSTEEWTNTLDLTVNTTLNSGEKLYYVIGNVKTQITASMPYTLALSSSTVTSDSTLETALAQNNNIVFQKENNAGKVIAKTILNIKNLDIKSPVVGTPVIKKYSDYTSVEFINATDDKSGISSCYYTTATSNYTALQLLHNGTKEESKYGIKVKPEVTRVQFVLVDNAGNMSGVQNVTIE